MSTCGLLPCRLKHFYDWHNGAWRIPPDQRNSKNALWGPCKRTSPNFRICCWPYWLWVRRSFMRPTPPRPSTAFSIPTGRGRRLSTPITPVSWSSHSPSRRRAGMAAEDEPISVNGVPFTGMAGLIRQTFHAHPGQIFLHRLSQSTGRDAYRASGADGAAKQASQLHRLADQHRAGGSSFPPSASCSAIGWCWPGRSNGMPGFCWAS